MAGSSAAVADSHLDMDTELTSQPGPQLLTPPSGQQLLCPDPTHNPNPNCDPKTEPESYSIEARPQRTGPSHSGHPRIDYELETEHQQIWTRDCVTETQHTHPIEWADDKERGGEQQLNAHLVHSTLSLPCRSHCSALFLRPRQSCHSTPSAPKSQSNCSTPSSSQSPSKLTSPDFSGFSHSSNHLTLPAKVMPLKKSSKKLKRKKFICSVCGKVLSSECYLKTHLAAHKGKTPYTCAQCGKSFSWYSSLKIHENTHTEWKPYACTLCPKTFGLYCNLKRHQVVHTGERPYRCMQCGKSFITCTQLKIHQNIHTGARPYACTLCPKTFANPGSLTHHKLVHTGEKAHCCTQCGKSFSRAESLKRHQSVHLVKGSSIENSTFQAEKRCPELAHGVVQQS